MECRQVVAMQLQLQGLLAQSRSRLASQNLPQRRRWASPSVASLPAALAPAYFADIWIGVWSLYLDLHGGASLLEMPPSSSVGRYI